MPNVNESPMHSTSLRCRSRSKPTASAAAPLRHAANANTCSAPSSSNSVSATANAIFAIVRLRRVAARGIGKSLAHPSDTAAIAAVVPLRPVIGQSAAEGAVHAHTHAWPRSACRSARTAGCGGDGASRERSTAPLVTGTVRRASVARQISGAFCGPEDAHRCVAASRQDVEHAVFAAPCDERPSHPGQVPHLPNVLY